MLSQACQRCWHRKQKCDRQSPECSTCVAAGVKCQPRVWGRVLSSDADDTSAHISATRSPIEYLKSRISYLENEGSREHERTTSSPPPTGTSLPQRQRQASATHGSQTSLGGVDDDLNASSRVADVTSNEVEYLSLTAMSGGGKNDQGQGQGLTLSQIMARIVSIWGINTPGFTTPDASSTVQSNPSLSEIEREMKALIGKDYSYLVRTFTRITSWYLPCISEAECLAAIDTVSRLQTTSTPSAEAIASSILALGGTFSPFQNSLQSLLQKLVDRSKQVLPEVLTTESDVIAVQCLILQALLSLYDPSAGSAWHLLGLALTKAVSTGLHRSSTTNNTNDDEAGNSENLFWTLYLLDRTVAISMGRPFGLEDDDVALKIPEIFMPSSSANAAAISRAIFVWKVHHALLLSQWRHQSANFDLDAGFASYEYWKDSYHEICERLIQVEKTEDRRGEGRDHAPSRSLLLKDEAQLSCRMLVHLLDQAARKVHFEDASLVQFKRHVVAELPGLIDVIHNAMDSESIALTFLDGYDAFAAAVMYVFCIYQPRQPSTFRLGITQMRTITASIDIIQHVGQQFKSLRRFKDIIWALLQALEARAEGRNAGQLENELTKCEVPIPNQIRRVIEICMQTHVE